MNKTDLIDALAGSGAIPRANADVALTAVLDAIAEALAAGEEVRLTGIGVLRPVTRAARAGTAPNGRQFETAASRGVKFKVAEPLARRLNGG